MDDPGGGGLGAAGDTLGALPALVLLLPVLAGLGATALAAFGFLPAIGHFSVSLDAWRALLAWPGLSASLALTLRVGLGSTLLSLLTALGIVASLHSVRRLRAVQAAIVPLLAVPHVALAIGLGFLIAPSGWIARLLSPWLTGWHTPPDLAIVHDRWGVALIAGLWLKETPYLVLMLLAALAQSGAARSLRGAAALGYAPWRAWTLLVLPRLWPQVWVPVLAVLAFSLSVVDVALVLGPATPPTLAVQVVRWLDDPDVALWLPAAAASVLLIALPAAMAGVLLALARGLAWVARRRLRHGHRGGEGIVANAAATGAALLLAMVGGASLLLLALWAGARSWRFPHPWPSGWSIGPQWAGLADPALETLALAAVTTVLALLLAIAWLRRGGGHAAILYAPLLVPQVAFLFGFQMVLVRLRLDGGWLALVWSHLLFVLPYVVLTLAGPFRALDPRLVRSAAMLRAGPWRVLLRISLPMLARPLLAATAVGFAVSVSLYLPTVFAGAGRVATLATEAVALSSGGDRRVLAATALAQAGLPLLAYAGAVLLPAWRARQRRGLAIAG